MQKKQLTKEQAVQKLRHYCRYQERCRAEVKTKLFELGINRNQHDEIVVELMNENYLNEERFALAFAAGRFKIRQWGRKKIQYELKDKKLNEGAIQNGLKQINENEYRHVLKKLAKEKYASLKNEPYLIRKKKTMDYLLQKGYEMELIRTFVEEMTN